MVTAFFVICVVFYLFMFSIASASALLNLEAITMRIKQSATKMYAAKPSHSAVSP